MVARNKVILQGSLGTGTQEVWSTGINFRGPTGTVVIDPVGLTQWAEDIRTLFDAFTAYPALGSALSTSGSLDEVVVQYYNASNVLVQQGVSAPDPEPGTGTLECPFTTSVVLSMRTGVPGGSYRGRNYWPALGIAITPDGLIGGTDGAPALASNWAGMLADIAEAFPELDVVEPVVYSPTLDLVTPVTTVLCGDVPDTQRRRRDNLTESYSSAAYVPN